MASSSSSILLPISLLLLAFLLRSSTAARRLADADDISVFKYHNGPLLTGNISVNLIWYGNFKPAQRAIVSDFIASLSSHDHKPANPSVASWFDKIQTLYKIPNSRRHPSLVLTSGAQIIEESYSLGKFLKKQNVEHLATKGAQSNAINVVLTASDVAVEGFCSGICGEHGTHSSKVVKGKVEKFAYIWVGNPEAQCPGQCAWPFHQPISGPQSPPLVAPNNDVGLDGMVINVATLLAGTVTNPFGNGFYQGPAEAPLEAASACSGVYGAGAYPGYAGNVLVDKSSGASYNANGMNGRKYLLPALFDPSAANCSTLV